LQRASGRLNISPTKPVAYPAYSCERCEARQALLLCLVITCEPGGRGIDSDGRRGRDWHAKPAQHSKGGPGEIRLIAWSEGEPVPTDGQLPETDGFPQCSAPGGEGGKASHLWPVARQAPFGHCRCEVLRRPDYHVLTFKKHVAGMVRQRCRYLP